MTPKPTKITVNLGANSYPILIGAGLLADLPLHIKPYLQRKRLAVITDENVARHHLPALQSIAQNAGLELATLTLPAGETTKSWAMLEKTCTWLLDQKIERGDLIVAFGGGVIGDLAGFAAAIVRRGVAFIQIPTTLLAQVDSAVGGKTGINTEHGKNLIGAFNQPRMVLADVALLDTLPRRDFLAGYGEVVKYGLLGDAGFFEWLEGNAAAMVAGDLDLRVATIARSCQIKADIVARDETEQGDRALLNLGHSFGHALEAATGYSGRLLHGEAVAIGCGLALELSVRLGLCRQDDPPRLYAHLESMGMKARMRDIDGDLPSADALIDIMAQDKKVKDGVLHFVLLRKVGAAFVSDSVPPEQVLRVLSSC